MKNRTSPIFAYSIIVLAIIGIFSSLVSNPTGFLQRIAVMILVGLTIYFVIKRFMNANPEKSEQRAFLRAAKKSKKKGQRRKTDEGSRTSHFGKLTSIKKKSSAHLTVIDGNKGKKKNRASL